MPLGCAMRQQPSSGSWSTSWLACIGLHVSCTSTTSLHVFSKSIEQHIAQLSDVFARLKGTGLKIRPSKCRLLQSSIGHVISGKGIKADPAKIACVANWPVPETTAELLSASSVLPHTQTFCE